MKKKRYRRVDKAGLPPGSLIYMGENSGEKTRISYYNYNSDKFEAIELDNPDSLPELSQDKNHWIHVQGIHNIEIIEKIGKKFNISPLILEDIVSSDHRSKSDIFEDYIFIILRYISYHQNDNSLFFEQLSFILKSNVLITFSDTSTDLFEPIIKRLQNPKNKFLSSGTDYLLYTLIDLTVDKYFSVTEEFNDQIDYIEDVLMNDADKSILAVVKIFKRNLLLILKNVRPLREVVRQLRDDDSKVISKDLDIYLRDVYDHIIQITESIETLRDMASSVLDIYLSSISNKTNEIMKVLTILSSIFIPLTFLAGVYGMNFQFMPELKWYYGYPLFWGLMIVLSVVLLLYFKKKKWM